jgi:hypothetical protein
MENQQIILVTAKTKARFPSLAELGTLEPWELPNASCMAEKPSYRPSRIILPLPAEEKVSLRRLKARNTEIKRATADRERETQAQHSVPHMSVSSLSLELTVHSAATSLRGKQQDFSRQQDRSGIPKESCGEEESDCAEGTEFFCIPADYLARSVIRTSLCLQLRKHSLT